MFLCWCSYQDHFSIYFCEVQFVLGSVLSYIFIITPWMHLHVQLLRSILLHSKLSLGECLYMCPLREICSPREQFRAGTLLCSHMITRGSSRFPQVPATGLAVGTGVRPGLWQGVLSHYPGNCFPALCPSQDTFPAPLPQLADRGRAPGGHQRLIADWGAGGWPQKCWWQNWKFPPPCPHYMLPLTWSISEEGEDGEVKMAFFVLF